jgi:ABC-type transport system substrate-binding protein
MANPDALLRLAATVLALLAVAGCNRVTNSPHPAGAESTNTLFTAFTARSPKYLDPTSSYSNDETPYTYQIYEPLYSYHYLKRPYELRPRAAERVVLPRYFDASGKELPADAAGEAIAESVYEIPIRKGVLFAPHPALARDAAGNYIYHSLSRRDTADKYGIKDFPLAGTRELTAHDYVYAIRRLATPRIKSPSFSLMSEYIVGLK